jgi:hypothetical protein
MLVLLIFVNSAKLSAIFALKKNGIRVTSHCSLLIVPYSLFIKNYYLTKALFCLCLLSVMKKKWKKIKKVLDTKTRFYFYVWTHYLRWVVWSEMWEVGSVKFEVRCESKIAPMSRRLPRSQCVVRTHHSPLLKKVLYTDEYVEQSIG